MSCRGRRWCRRVNIGRKHELKRGCFFVLSAYSPSLASFPPFDPPSTCSVLMLPTPPTLPVHSIRLDYGCVVVDTCAVWSVSQCCCAMSCSSSCRHRTRSKTEEKGRPRFPKLKKKKKEEPFVPISHPSSLSRRDCLDFHRNTFSGISLWMSDRSCMYLHCNMST